MTDPHLFIPVGLVPAPLAAGIVKSVKVLERARGGAASRAQSIAIPTTPSERNLGNRIGITPRCSVSLRGSGGELSKRSREHSEWNQLYRAFHIFSVQRAYSRVGGGG